MLFEKILYKLSENSDNKNIVRVGYEWFEAEKKILKKTMNSGEEAALRLGEPLYDGAVLFDDGERIIAAELIPCEVIRVNVSGAAEMGRLCFELGNRHLPVAIYGDRAETPYDAPCFEYLKKLGFDCSVVTAKFEPTVIVRGHSHESHEHEHGHEHR